MLVTRPRHDATLATISAWCEPLIKLATKKQLRVLDLSANNANRKNLESYLKKKRPSLVFFNGHGTSKTILGHNNEIIIKEGGNDNLLAGSIVYIRCCESASSLGDSMVKKGAKAVIGYVRSFSFIHSSSFTSRPLKDKMAGLFIEPSNMIVATLIKGRSANEAFTKSQRHMINNFKRMTSSDATFEERSASPYLWSNIDGQKLMGDPQAKTS